MGERVGNEEKGSVDCQPAPWDRMSQSGPSTFIYLEVRQRHNMSTTEADSPRPQE